MDKEIMEQFQLLANGMVQMEERLKEYVDERARHTEILIENTITKRLDSLFDGYKLTHEKQYELERKVEALEQRLIALEEKTA